MTRFTRRWQTRCCRRSSRILPRRRARSSPTRAVPVRKRHRCLTSSTQPSEADPERVVAYLAEEVGNRGRRRRHRRYEEPARLGAGPLARGRRSFVQRIVALQKDLAAKRAAHKLSPRCKGVSPRAHAAPARGGPQAVCSDRARGCASAAAHRAPVRVEFCRCWWTAQAIARTM